MKPETMGPKLGPAIKSETLESKGKSILHTGKGGDCKNGHGKTTIPSSMKVGHESACDGKWSGSCEEISGVSIGQQSKTYKKFR